MKRGIVLSAASVFTGVAVAQTPFANLYWEASDGGAWTRNLLTTARQSTQLRLVAEWGAGGAFCFGGTSFDASVSASTGDVVSNPLRLGRFVFEGQTLASMRFGNIIKLDDVRDTDLPGAGTRWIATGQSDGTFGEIVDQSNPAILFAFDFAMEDTPGTRQISSIHRSFDAQGTNTFLWGATSIRVTAAVFGVDITYVPAPSTFAVLAGAFLITRRRR